MSAHLALAGAGIGVLVAAVWIAPVADDDSRTHIVFLGLLPLLNALFDWLSVGVTRSLLRRSEARPWLAVPLGLADLFIALGLFVLLRATIIVTLVLMNRLHTDGDVIDLAAVFADLRDPAGAQSYWWLYAVIFTTLVPTMLHASLAVLSLPAAIPAPVRRWTSRRIAGVDGSFFNKFGAVVGLGGMTLWALILPPALLVGLWYGLVAAFPALGGLYLDAFQWLACSLDTRVSCP